MIRQLDNNIKGFPIACRRGLLLVIAALNMVLAPCAMAFGPDDGCAHTAAVESQMDHGAAHAHHETGSDPHCAGAAYVCCESAGVATESRTSKSADDKTGEQPVLFLQAVPDRQLASVVETTSGPPGPGSGAAAPPIHLLNCVFLD